MISIEKVQNGFVVRIEEGEDDYTIVLQKEFNSMNVALGSLCKTLIDRWQDTSEQIGVRIEVSP
jgi:hypothetical protein